jgi:hypothetical protein
MVVPIGIPGQSDEFPRTSQKVPWTRACWIADTSNMSLRSSATDPLRIDSVPAGVSGRIGLTFCPGKYQPVSMSCGWQRDLALDLDVYGAIISGGH